MGRKTAKAEAERRYEYAELFMRDNCSTYQPKRLALLWGRQQALMGELAKKSDPPKATFRLKH